MTVTLHNKKNGKFKITKLSDDEKLSLAMCIQTPVLMFQLFLLYGVGLLQFHTVTRTVSIVICAAVFVLALPVVLKRRPLLAVGTYVFVVLALLISIAAYPDIKSFLGKFSFSLFTMCLPAFICASCLKNTDAFIKILSVTSKIIFVIGLLYGITVLTGRNMQEDYSMAFSYYMLWPATVFYYLFLKCKKFRYFFYSFVVLLEMIYIGSRGAVLFCVVFYGLGLLFAWKELDAKKAGLIIVILILTVFVIVFFNQVVDVLISISASLGMKSRTLMLLDEGSFISHDSGRKIFQSTIIEAIKEKPLLGHGIGGEYVLINGYSHNIFLDIFCQFGIIAGMIIVFCAIASYINNLIFEHNKLIFALLLCVCWMPMCVSGTYLSSPDFWMLLGLCTAFSFRRRSNVKKAFLN